MKSILVIGGGFVGATSALRLQQAGVQTALIDPGDMRRAASWGNAGHLGPEQVTPWSAWENVLRAPRSSFAFGGPLDFRWRDAASIAPWVLRFLAACDPRAVVRGEAALTALLGDAMAAWTRLARDVGAPGLVLPHGHASVWTTEAAADKGRAAAARSQWGTAAYRDLHAGELERYARIMKQPPRAGLLFSGTGQVSNPQSAREAILTAFVGAGGELVADSAARVEADGRVALASGAERRADGVLIAAGAWSGALMAQLGQRAPLIGERGYSLQSAETDWPRDLPTTIFEEFFLVFTRFNNGLRATSCIEFGAPDAPADARKWRLMQKRIGDLGVTFSGQPDRWVGPRPTLPDYVPAIGRLKRAPKVLYAFGHAHLGLTMCAVTAELVAALASERKAAIEMAPFAIERFG